MDALKNGPVFVYTQSQNVHTVTLSRLGDQRPPRKSYPGFNQLYASELERLDAGFGQFIDYLKKRGTYDDSIVILTADHGDQFGGMGRQGHTSTFFQMSFEYRSLCICRPG